MYSPDDAAELSSCVISFTLTVLGGVFNAGAATNLGTELHTKVHKYVHSFNK